VLFCDVTFPSTKQIIFIWCDAIVHYKIGRWIPLSVISRNLQEKFIVIRVRLNIYNCEINIYILIYLSELIYLFFMFYSMLTFDLYLFFCGVLSLWINVREYWRGNQKLTIQKKGYTGQRKTNKAWFPKIKEPRRAYNILFISILHYNCACTCITAIILPLIDRR